MGLPAHAIFVCWDLGFVCLVGRYAQERNQRDKEVQEKKILVEQRVENLGMQRLDSWIIFRQSIHGRSMV